MSLLGGATTTHDDRKASMVFLWQELRYIKSYASADGVAVMKISIGHAHSLNIRDESIYDDLKLCWQ